jgi:hypothetical protein
MARAERGISSAMKYTLLARGSWQASLPLPAHSERSHSGLVQHLGKVPYRKVPRVRISPSPPNENAPACLGLFHLVDGRFEAERSEG